MLKILYGTAYDLARLVGIKSEMWVRVTGKEPPITDTQYGTGIIVTNTITSETGCVFDTDSEYFNLFEPHLSRLIDIDEAGDGWIDIVEGE